MRKSAALFLFIVSVFCVFPQSINALTIPRLQITVAPQVVITIAPLIPPLKLVDVLPPTISNISANTTLTGATISWSTNEKADTYVDFGTTNQYGKTAGQMDMVTEHVVTLSNLSAFTTYHYSIRSKDAAGNQTKTADSTFFTFQKLFIIPSNTPVPTPTATPTTIPSNTPQPTISSVSDPVVNPTETNNDTSAATSPDDLQPTVASSDSIANTQVVTEGIQSSYPEGFVDFVIVAVTLFVLILLIIIVILLLIVLKNRKKNQTSS
jgi:hypothetical protein